LTLYWAKALAEQQESSTLQEQFTPIAASLEENLDLILAEIDASQGEAQDTDGYYQPDRTKASAAMFPSKTFKTCLGI
jgi:isocitrate dehydrogenase